MEQWQRARPGQLILEPLEGKRKLFGFLARIGT
jgi:hypothetical protein